jgi:hypothetical protein
VQPCREVLKPVAMRKHEFLEGGEEVKGVLLLLAEALHLFDLRKEQLGEGGREEAADGHSKEPRTASVSICWSCSWCSASPPLSCSTRLGLGSQPAKNLELPLTR